MGECKNFQDGPTCVKDCPVIKYPDDNKYCQPCHDNCEEGCSGPRNTIGEEHTLTAAAWICASHGQNSVPL